LARLPWQGPTRDRDRDRHRPRGAVRVAAMTAAGLVLSACAGNGDMAPDGEDAAGATDPGLGHVHGLDVNPGEDAVYAATHTGVWRIPTVPQVTGPTATLTAAGQPTRIANRQQDTMGFTIAGRDDFYASGHPSLTEQPDLRPPLLGLVRSTDRATTWKTLSLRGKVDFHDIEVHSNSRVVGYSAAGQVLISGDGGRTWQAGATQELRDLAVDPQDPDVILATASKGLLRSGDAGRTFTRVGGTPTLLLLDWANRGAQRAELWGVDTTGAVWQARSADPAGVWERRGLLPAAPEAFTAHLTGGGGTVLLATDERGVVTSADDGETWSLLASYLPGEHARSDGGDHGGDG
jgi:hypothetical protein